MQAKPGRWGASRGQEQLKLPTKERIKMFDNLDQEERTLIRCLREMGESPFNVLQKMHNNTRIILRALSKDQHSSRYNYYHNRLKTIEEYLLIADKVKYGEHEEEPIQTFVPWIED